MAIVKDQSGNIVVTGEHIRIYRLLAMEKRLKLEIMGIRFRTPTAPLVRAELKIKERSKKKLYEKLKEYNARLLLNNSVLKEE